MRNTTNGFTLVELIIVIVILGILAVTAAPRFIDLSSDARSAKLDSIAGSVESVANLVYAKSLISNSTTGASSVTLADGTTIQTHSGYPRAWWDTAARYLVSLDAVATTVDSDPCTTDICGNGGRSVIPGGPTIATGGQAAIFWFKGDTPQTRCYAYYINNYDGSAPIIGTVNSGC